MNGRENYGNVAKLIRRRILQLDDSKNKVKNCIVQLMLQNSKEIKHGIF